MICFADLPMEFTVPSIYIILSYFMGGLRRTPGEIPGPSVIMIHITCNNTPGTHIRQFVH